MKAQNQNIKVKVEQLRNSLSGSDRLKPIMPVTQNLLDAKKDKTLSFSEESFKDK